MAKCDTCPVALRAWQIHYWVGRILQVDQIGETPILLVIQAARVYLGMRKRTTVGQGIFLVPRWIPLAEEDWEIVRGFSEDSWRSFGIIKTEKGLQILIYQQVADLYALVRQQGHILFDEEQTDFFRRYIAPLIRARRGAAVMLARCRVRDLKGVRTRSLANLLTKLQSGKIATYEPAGMVCFLNSLIDSLNVVTERPFVTRRKYAQRSLRRAQFWIGKGDFTHATRLIQSAIRNLDPLPRA